jgi:hypothetical protein
METGKDLVAIQALEDLITEYNQKITQLQFTISVIKGAFNQASETPQKSLEFARDYGFPYHKKLRQKVLYAFGMLNRAVHINQLNEYLASQEPSLKDDAKGIRNVLTSLKLDGLIKSKKAGKSNLTFVWGLSEWFIDDDTINPEFMYDINLFE